MIELAAEIHDRVSVCRRELEEIATYGQFLNSPQIAGAGPGVIADTINQLAVGFVKVRAILRFWTLQRPQLKNQFVNNGSHKRVVNIAGLLVGAMPAQQPKDDARVYAMGLAQWKTVTQQYAADLAAQHLVLPSDVMLNGDFDIVRSNWFGTLLNDAQNLKQAAISNAQTALAAIGNALLMNQAETAKRTFYRKFDELICLARTAPEMNQAEQLVTQGYIPLDQIDA